MSAATSTAPGTASVDRAAALARRGSYDLALAVLARLGGRSSTEPEVLDLLARVHAQRGELHQADECWAAVLLLDQDHAGALAGRRRIAALTAPRSRPRVGRAAFVVLVAASTALGAGVVGGLVVREPTGSDPALVGALDRLGTAQQSQAVRVTDLDRRLSRDVVRRQQVLDRLSTALAGDPRLSVHLTGDAVLVVFTAGVFQSGDRLSAGGSAALADLARRLRPLAAQVTVAVVGHTEDARVSDPRYRDNVDLGLVRAEVAAQRLAAAGGLPLPAITLASAGAAEPPYPNTTDAGRLGNRTVTVTVRPR